MPSILLITTLPTQEQLTQIFAEHQDLNYIFFYGDSTHAINQTWSTEKPFNICRTALLRRNLIKENTELTQPWMLNSLYDFYQHLAKSQTLLILDQHGLHQKAIKASTEPSLLFILENLSKITEPEEWIELIIGASLSFKVHVYIKDPIITHPWDKHLTALSHYDIEIDAQLDEDKFAVIIDCY